ncbi:methyltransferase domain-containing protein [Vitreoscilla stercoraria]|uniref:Class I SAM-dependent methyltransferase n=1 Tax=Vitreoscilla stercoraria TaxID=61 RepID=A0ABY4E815_VITST|nr:class I SAM-dependent methyltransferase [Vitreoscilla stercoraria]UOO91550.1 class I SAM-dependent methyltransferase [Vitreoscilla stercoraria]
MHPTAMQNAEIFFKTYAASFDGQIKRVVEIGSQDVNGSLKTHVPMDFEYVGVDFVAGKGVDVVLDDPYSLPFEDEMADIVISSSCFEHSEMFWLVFLEVMRILKPHGLFYLNAPSNGVVHRYPVDCWRFYPDSGHALVTWARRNHIPAVLLESYTSKQAVAQTLFAAEDWNDFVAVFLKNGEHIHQYPNRILHTKKDVYNGISQWEGAWHEYEISALTEDQLKLQKMQNALYSQHIAF